MNETVDILSYKPMSDILHYFNFFLCFPQILSVRELHLLHHVSIVVHFALHSVDGAKTSLANLALDGILAHHFFILF